MDESTTIFYFQQLCTRTAGMRRKQAFAKAVKTTHALRRAASRTLNFPTKQNTGKQPSGKIQASASGRL